MADHSREGQTIGRRFAVVVVAAGEVRVVFDGEDLLEENEAIEDGRFVAGGDGNDETNPLGKKIGEGEAASPPTEGPMTAWSWSMPRRSSRRALERTTSAIEIFGKSGPQGWPVAGLMEEGPVEP